MTRNEWESSLTIANSIVYDNQPNGIEWNNGDVTVRYSDVQSWGTSNGNLSADPLFVDAAFGDFRLSEVSPCIDAASGLNATEADLQGKPRYNVVAVPDAFACDTAGDPCVDSVDMGAFEFLEE